MWVFGYGSLMWDGWQTQHGCIRQVLADLPGYSRAFNKVSVRNWGSTLNPCPTLSLRKTEGDNGNCRGMAFEFPDSRRQRVLAYLVKRGDPPTELPIRLDDGTHVRAAVPLYTGPNIIIKKTPDQIATMIRTTRGRDGPCLEYVKGIAEKLNELGIMDAEVQAVWETVKG
jgi:glutathione-specific gamma-glutamylcyclotransferase